MNQPKESVTTAFVDVFWTASFLTRCTAASPVGYLHVLKTPWVWIPMDVSPFLTWRSLPGEKRQPCRRLAVRALCRPRGPARPHRCAAALRAAPAFPVCPGTSLGTSVELRGSARTSGVQHGHSLLYGALSSVLSLPCCGEWRTVTFIICAYLQPDSPVYLLHPEQ